MDLPDNTNWRLFSAVFAVLLGTQQHGKKGIEIISDPYWLKNTCLYKFWVFYGTWDEYDYESNLKNGIVNLSHDLGGVKSDCLHDKICPESFIQKINGTQESAYNWVIEKKRRSIVGTGTGKNSDMMCYVVIESCKFIDFLNTNPRY